MLAAGCDPRLAPNLQRRRVVAKGDTDIFQKPIDLTFEFLKLIFVQQIEKGQRTPDIR